jgi:hypothetical protein
MTDAQWLEVQQVLQGCKAELEDELSDDYRERIMFDANKILLRKLLARHRHDADESGSS